MLLIVAAMSEELEQAKALCPNCEKIANQDLCYWQAQRANKRICFFKTGIGPKRSSANMERILGELSPNHILMIGYAGALDPSLKLGDLVGVKKALACSLAEGDPDLSHLQADREFELSDADAIVETAKSSGLRASAGDTLSSAFVLGVPEHKQLLYEKHHASIVDMETAAIAGVAASRNIRFSCARSISDEAADSFLAPFSYNPSANLAKRAVKIVSSGVQSYQEWKNNSRIAGDALNRFLSCYL
jgi:nucleoside phosphorylase